jgi:SAM-dependent methyltransferase
MFYGPDQSSIHDARFGDLARDAASFLAVQLDAAGLHRGTVVDLGCGSGILAGLLGDAGYDVVGVDISADMIALARKNAPRATLHVGSMLDLELPPAVAVTAIGEALNYATDPRAGVDELSRLAARVHDTLAPGGVFLFDVAGPGRHGPDGIKFHDHEDWFLANRVEESADHATLHRRITIFMDTGDGRYRRSDEHHVLRLYEPEALMELLTHAGFTAEFLTSYGATTASTPLAGWTVVLARPARSPRPS